MYIYIYIFFHYIKALIKTIVLVIKEEGAYISIIEGEIIKDGPIMLCLCKYPAVKLLDLYKRKN